MTSTLLAASLHDLISCKEYKSGSQVVVKTHTRADGTHVDVKLPATWIAMVQVAATDAIAALTEENRELGTNRIVTAMWFEMPEDARLDMWRGFVSEAEWTEWQTSRASSLKVSTASFLRRDFARLSKPAAAMVEALSGRTETADAISDLLTNSNVGRHAAIKQHLVSLQTAAAKNDEALLALLDQHDRNDHTRGVHRHPLII